MTTNPYLQLVTKGNPQGNVCCIFLIYRLLILSVSSQQQQCLLSITAQDLGRQCDSALSQFLIYCYLVNHILNTLKCY